MTSFNPGVRPSEGANLRGAVPSIGGHRSNPAQGAAKTAATLASKTFFGNSKPGVEAKVIPIKRPPPTGEQAKDKQPDLSDKGLRDNLLKNRYFGF